MRGFSFKIVRIFGIDIRIHLTLFLTFGLLVWLFSDIFAIELSQYSSLAWYALAALTAILFFASLLFHELAHSLVAKQENEGSSTSFI